MNRRTYLTKMSSITTAPILNQGTEIKRQTKKSDSNLEDKRIEINKIVVKKSLLHSVFPDLPGLTTESNVQYILLNLKVQSDRDAPEYNDFYVSAEEGSVFRPTKKIGDVRLNDIVMSKPEFAGVYNTRSKYTPTEDINQGAVAIPVPDPLEIANVGIGYIQKGKHVQIFQLGSQSTQVLSSTAEFRLDSVKSESCNRGKIVQAKITNIGDDPGVVTGIYHLKKFESAVGFNQRIKPKQTIQVEKKVPPTYREMAENGSQVNSGSMIIGDGTGKIQVMEENK